MVLFYMMEFNDHQNHLKSQGSGAARNSVNSQGRGNRYFWQGSGEGLKQRNTGGRGAPVFLCLLCHWCQTATCYQTRITPAVLVVGRRTILGQSQFSLKPGNDQLASETERARKDLARGYNFAGATWRTDDCRIGLSHGRTPS